jgi:hypothetical protein
MEYASVCPICSQTLQLGTSEPHPTRDGVDILYRCEQCGPDQVEIGRPPNTVAGEWTGSASLRPGSLANSKRFWAATGSERSEFLPTHPTMFVC